MPSVIEVEVVPPAAASGSGGSTALFFFWLGSRIEEVVGTPLWFLFLGL